MVRIVFPQISQLPVKSFVGLILLESKLLLTQLLEVLGDHNPVLLYDPHQLSTLPRQSPA